MSVSILEALQNYDIHTQVEPLLQEWVDVESVPEFEKS